MLAATAVLLSFAQADGLRGVVPCGVERTKRCCGDGICNGPEDIKNCLADCAQNFILARTTAPSDLCPCPRQVLA